MDCLEILCLSSVVWWNGIRVCISGLDLIGERVCTSRLWGAISGRKPDQRCFGSAWVDGSPVSQHDYDDDHDEYVKECSTLRRCLVRIISVGGSLSGLHPCQRQPQSRCCSLHFHPSDSTWSRSNTSKRVSQKKTRWKKFYIFGYPDKRSCFISTHQLPPGVLIKDRGPRAGVFFCRVSQKNWVLTLKETPF